MTTMTKHRTGTREEWLTARLELLEAEKELTRRSDELSRRRQELPWVRIDKEYLFETEEGSASLAELFRGGACSSSFTTSCSGPTTPPAVQPVRRLRTDTTAASSIWGEPRRHTVRRFRGRPAGEAASLQAADGLDVSLGVLVRRGLQLRIRGCVHRGPAAVGSRREQLPHDKDTRSELSDQTALSPSMARTRRQ